MKVPRRSSLYRPLRERGGEGGRGGGKKKIRTVANDQLLVNTHIYGFPRKGREGGETGISRRTYLEMFERVCKSHPGFRRVEAPRRIRGKKKNPARPNQAASRRHVAVPPKTGGRGGKEKERKKNLELRNPPCVCVWTWEKRGGGKPKKKSRQSTARSLALQPVSTTDPGTSPVREKEKGKKKRKKPYGGRRFSRRHHLYRRRSVDAAWEGKKEKRGKNAPSGATSWEPAASPLHLA